MTTREQSAATVLKRHSAESSSHELLQLTQEALNLAQAACYFDKTENYVVAYDYYDKTILNIDEAMSKLPRNSIQWTRLLELRTVYDDRMEVLKEMENRRYRPNSIASSEKIIDENSKFSLRRRRKCVDDTNFKELLRISENYAYTEPPTETALVPYWVLNSIQQTIENGGFLTKSIFIPKKVWMQSEVKFSGQHIKITAFELILKLLSTHVDTLYFSHDEDSLVFAEQSIATLLEEMLGMQAQLSKPFNYVREPPRGQASEGTEGSSSHESVDSGHGSSNSDKKTSNVSSISTSGL
jgi:hypothetical protein